MNYTRISDAEDRDEKIKIAASLVEVRISDNNSITLVPKYDSVSVRVIKNDRSFSDRPGYRWRKCIRIRDMRGFKKKAVTRKVNLEELIAFQYANLLPSQIFTVIIHPDYKEQYYDYIKEATEDGTYKEEDIDFESTLLVFYKKGSSPEHFSMLDRKWRSGKLEPTFVTPHREDN